MVKSKKGKADKIDPDDISTNNTDEVERVNQMANIKKSSLISDSGDDDDEMLNSVAKPVVTNKMKKSKGKAKVQVNSDDEDGDSGATKIAGLARAGGFASLMDDNDDDDYDSDVEMDQGEDDDEEKVETKVKPQKATKNDKKTKHPPAKENKKKGNNKDDDIDKILLELEMTKLGDAKTDVSEESAGKTAAQKKKEKKERQKREAAMQKEHPNETVVVEKDVKPEENLAPEAPVETPDANDAEIKEPSVVDDKKKKKKDKNEKTAKAKIEEEKEKSRKGPSKNVVAAMQEHLKKMKEEEERLRREEEEKVTLLEEAENLRLEQLRLETEKKEKRKQKEKERKERLKAEGKLLSNKQKQDKLRAQAMLEALKAQGLDVPEIGGKRPRPGTRVRNNKKNQAPNTLETQTSIDKTDDAESSAKDEIVDENDTTTVEKVEDVKEAWDASSSSEEEENGEDVTDDVPNMEHKVQPPAEIIKKADVIKKTKEVKVTAEKMSKDADNETDESSADENMNDDERKQDAEYRRQRVVERIQKRRRDAETKRTLDKLRAAVVCVLGHVDTGKTKILDKLRRTNVQDGEAGGITQQIGATNVPIDVIKEQTKIVKNFSEMTFKLPGLLIIDTPGHESFSNLRSRGSSLCDIAILVVDIMHGLEPQTIESINLLKSKKTPFIVALNKIDRLYDWQTMGKKDVRDIIKGQQANTQLEFEQRTKKIITEFAEQSLNAALFYENPDSRSYVSLIPTSAITGEGMGNLLFLIIEACQNLLAKRLMYSEDLLATVLEVKAIPGLGTTIDAILINGKLREGDTMIVAGTDGPIVTQIRSLLMPQPMKELRVKNAYIEHKEIMAAQGVKIAAKDLEKAIAGLNMQVAQKSDEVDILKEEVAKELKSALNSIKLSALGVYVQASTLGSLEALLQFLKVSKIPYSGIRIGPVVKRDVMKASTMLTHESQYATILAFDVKIERDAQELADSLGVKIFQADIIYHLFDKFTAYCDALKQKKRDEFKSIAVFPCKLKILPQFIFNSRDPIVMGVIVEAGILKEGTPICVPTKEFVELGIITSIESNHKQIPTARKGQEICIKIEPLPGEAPKMFGRHFDDTDFLVSKITRQSIDACKEYFRDDLIKTDWALMVELKKQFQIL